VRVTKKNSSHRLKSRNKSSQFEQYFDALIGVTIPISFSLGPDFFWQNIHAKWSHNDNGPSESGVARVYK
jgi:hypothetical protein